MPTLVSGDTLSLNNLAGATGQATKSLSAAAGSTASPISMSAFAIDGVGSLSGYTYLVEGTTENFTLGFDNQGTRFSRIRNRGENFTWSIPTQGGYLSLSTDAGYIRTFSVGSMNPQSPGNQTTLQSVVRHDIRVVFADGFNDHADNYYENHGKTVYTVDSYDGNSTALCLKSDTLVTLSDGSTIEIGDLEEGMKLKGYSLNGLDSSMNMMEWNSSELSPEEVEVNVVNVVFSFAERAYNINNGEIIATAEHPLVVKDSNNVFKFKTIHSVVVGDSLIKGDGSSVLVDSIMIEEGTIEIVSLDVDGTDTYLANGFITHNKGANTHTDLGIPGAPNAPVYTVVDGANKNLTWTAGTSSGTTGVTAYDVQVSLVSNFASTVLDFTEYSTTTLNIVALPTATYYARVRAIDHGLKSNWSSTLSNIVHTKGVGI